MDASYWLVIPFNRRACGRIPERRPGRRARGPSDQNYADQRGMRATAGPRCIGRPTWTTGPDGRPGRRRGTILDILVITGSKPARGGSTDEHGNRERARADFRVLRGCGDGGGRGEGATRV